MELASLNIGGAPNRGNARYPSGRIWPDGTVSLGYVHPRKDERLDARPADYSALPDDGTAAAVPLALRNVPHSDTPPRGPIRAGPEGQ